MPDTSLNQRKVLSVAEVTRRVRMLLEQQMGRVWIEGECSNVSTPNSGHIYFTLKDENSQIQAAWFKGRRAPDALMPKEGMKVRLFGLITAYERSSQIQIRVEDAEDAGLGDLQKRFSELKDSLQKEGLFDASSKRPLPLLPRRIGIITSPTGAAIRDILHVLARRYPDRQVLIAPVPVQGDAAAASIARAIDYFQKNQNVDVLIVGRGGGSLEDLWAFNEEVVARAVFACTIPLISAVGHEIDFTISDFVADLRAPTPSAAAELVIGRKSDFEQQVQRLEQRLRGALNHRRLFLRHRLSDLQSHKLFHEPAHVVSGYRQQLERFQDRFQRALYRQVTDPQRTLSEHRLLLRHHMEHRVHDAQRRVDDLDQNLHRLRELRMRHTGDQLAQFQKQLHAYNPYQVLRRGFSITRTADGTVIEKPETLKPGARLETLTHTGVLLSTLDKVTTRKN
ncbi:MAG: exodeoxyribonuclease VII large subunit [Kiritimatiellia bacterium]